MPQHIVFLRAVNVAPRWAPMAQLREALGAAGFDEVRTHIQTGNIALATPLRSAAKVAHMIESVVLERFGFPTVAMVRSPARLVQVLADAEAAVRCEGETRRYVSFAAGPIAAGAEELDAWNIPGEIAEVHDAEVHWGLAGTIHDSTLGNARIEKIAGQPTTARDLKVVRAVVEKWY